MADVIKVTALLLGSALLMFAGGLQGLLITVRGGEEGFSLAALGLIGTSWSVGYIAGTLIVPKLVSRVGHIRSYSVMAAVASVVILFNLLFIEQNSWIVLRAFSGFCFAGAAMIVESWINEVTNSDRRGTVFSSYTMVNLVFVTAGQMALSVVGVSSLVPFVLGAMAFSLAVLPTAMSMSPQPKPLLGARLNLGLLYKTSPVAVIASLIVGVAGGVFGTLAPVYGIKIGLDSATIAYLMSLSMVIGAVAQLPFGRLSDKIDRRVVLIATSLISAVAGTALVLLNPGNGWLLYLLFGLYGLAANSIYAVAVAHANDHADESDFANVASGLILLYGIGLAIGPIIGSFVMSVMMPVSLFIVTAAFHALLAIYAYYRMQVSARVGKADRSPFRAMPAGRETTPETVALDPRTDEEWLETEYETIAEDQEPVEDNGIHGDETDIAVDTRDAGTEDKDK
ncbi:MFS transporter [Cucumibacter marinus]|uniref:MFS transporter n=1 Tax=Cucumibacter marinus TaxID=1121252 RepID=UPI00041D82E3|nr:MFS transporter [Cucumibacter marinus]